MFLKGVSLLVCCIVFFELSTLCLIASMFPWMLMQALFAGLPLASGPFAPGFSGGSAGWLDGLCQFLEWFCGMWGTTGDFRKI